ncbi:MAG: hypothetical protein KGH62_03915, partial [Candidatus Micrarchaeota archaeon]|nr:hypothetical protein [Candidatus Micrarchaeota archaeon]
IYVNGQQVTASTKPCSIWEDVGGTFDIGNAGVTTGVAPMYIANLQFYNTALSANSIQALYQEGLGGEPIDLADLIGWWPLNGDTLDYSGYGNNGYSPVNTVYVGNWWQSSTYTGAP